MLLSLKLIRETAFSGDKYFITEIKLLIVTESFFDEKLIFMFVSAFLLTFEVWSLFAALTE